jgi:hypothetical protein
MLSNRSQDTHHCKFSKENGEKRKKINQRKNESEKEDIKRSERKDK